ncbi:Uncharacterised protein [Klebsiella grimontii]|uniref:Uncharacterized protein n=1 Tax=Klebsiella grimontii TaxID=2058152 RepID=A0A7H4P5X2_9ENTR|nr:Uncharacterised protein [Klebsiella grimontii]
MEDMTLLRLNLKNLTLAQQDKLIFRLRILGWMD